MAIFTEQDLATLRNRKPKIEDVKLLNGKILELRQEIYQKLNKEVNAAKDDLLPEVKSIANKGKISEYYRTYALIRLYSPKTNIGRDFEKHLTNENNSYPAIELFMGNKDGEHEKFYIGLIIGYDRTISTHRTDKQKTKTSEAAIELFKTIKINSGEKFFHKNIEYSSYAEWKNATEDISSTWNSGIIYDIDSSSEKNEIVDKYVEFVKRHYAELEALAALAENNEPDIDLNARQDENGEQKIFPANLIFYGPPGTGKTFKTKEKAINFIAPIKPPKDLASLNSNFELVKGIKGIKTNITTFNSALNSNVGMETGLVDKLSMFKHWYYSKSLNMFGPSKFLGYEGMQPQRYSKYARDGLTGTETEDVLSKVVKSENADSFTENKLREFLKRFEKQLRLDAVVKIIE